MRPNAIANLLRDDHPEGTLIRLRMFQFETADHGGLSEAEPWTTKPALNTDIPALTRAASEIIARADALRATHPERCANATLAVDETAETLTFVLDDLRVAVVEVDEPALLPVKKGQTNIEFVTELMNFSPAGALGQLVVMEAIESYANKVAAQTPDQVAAKWTMGIVSPYAWHRACVHIAEQFKAKRR